MFLASGSVVNFNNGDVTLTHGSNTLVLDGGSLDLNAQELILDTDGMNTSIRSYRRCYTFRIVKANDLTNLN